MKTKTFRIIGRTNGYIASRDIKFKGKCRIVLANELTLKEAQRRILDFYNESYQKWYSNWGLVRMNDPYNSWSHKDGTRGYEFDSRYYYIEEEEVL